MFFALISKKKKPTDHRELVGRDRTQLPSKRAWPSGQLGCAGVEDRYQKRIWRVRTMGHGLLPWQLEGIDGMVRMLHLPTIVQPALVFRKPDSFGLWLAMRETSCRKQARFEDQKFCMIARRWPVRAYVTFKVQYNDSLSWQAGKLGSSPDQLLKRPPIQTCPSPAAPDNGEPADQEWSRCPRA